MGLRFERDEIVHEGRFLRYIKRFVTDTLGRSYPWEMVERTTPGPIVAVCAVTEHDQVLLTRSWRAPAKGYVLEFVAGLMDKEGEDPLDTAKRELLEETGHTATHWEPMLHGPFHTGVISDEITVFLATGARKVQEPTLEPTEDLQVVTVARTELAGFLRNPGADTLVDLKLWGALYFLDRLPQR